MNLDETDFTSAKAHVQVVLDILGLPTRTDENFEHTAARFVKYLQYYTQHYDSKTDLGVTFPLKKTYQGNPACGGALEYNRALVVEVGIPFRACCAHHLLPVLGTAHIGYIPKKRVVGLSKIPRLLYGITHRMPSLQEDVCDEVTDALMEHLMPQGAMCVIKAEHGCMAARGVEEATGCIQTVTASVKGVFIDKHEAREEFYRLVNVAS